MGTFTGHCQREHDRIDFTDGVTFEKHMMTEHGARKPHVGGSMGKGPSYYPPAPMKTAKPYPWKAPRPAKDADPAKWDGDLTVDLDAEIAKAGGRSYCLPYGAFQIENLDDQTTDQHAA